MSPQQVEDYQHRKDSLNTCTYIQPLFIQTENFKAYTVQAFGLWGCVLNKKLQMLRKIKKSQSKGKNHSYK